MNNDLPRAALALLGLIAMLVLVTPQFAMLVALTLQAHAVAMRRFWRMQVFAFAAYRRVYREERG
jgi:hypothetical protein